MIKNKKICVVGLGYVGIPLAISLVKKKFKVIGYDTDKNKINELRNGKDSTNESKKYGSNHLKKIIITSDQKLLSSANIFIITVPTPVDNKNNPDLTSLKDACIVVAKNLKNKDLVIIESTIYPKTTENICVPILKKYSGLSYLNEDGIKNKKKYFLCGYSPERINPGDDKRTLKNITKVVSGSNKQAKDIIKKLYQNICDDVYLAESIEVAESAKIIENTQRDINIALINEFQKIFNLLNINVYDVLKAAKTKWNFLNFEPGFVGGHCIGVDPYYLAYCSKKVGYDPKLILSGRKINNQVVNDFFVRIKSILKKKNIDKKKKILFIGASFKENCNDIRNSKVLELAEKLNQNFDLFLFDPYVDYNFLKNNTNCKVIREKQFKSYDVIILANKHNFIKKIGLKKLRQRLIKNGLILDLKNIFNLYNDLL